MKKNGNTVSRREVLRRSVGVAELAFGLPMLSAGARLGRAGTPPQDKDDGRAARLNYEWKPVRLGAGGFVSGLDIHPSGSPVFCRTDVGGAYRWDEAERRWTQVLRAEAMPPGDELVARLMYHGVSSIVSAPSDPNRAYMAYGDAEFGAVYVSHDRGRRWTGRSNKTDFYINANARVGRFQGERLAVDPADADVVYFGSQRAGLWRSFDGGLTLEQVPVDQVPVGGADTHPKGPPGRRYYVGVGNVLFDPSAGTVNGRTRRIYATVYHEGVYASEDAGETWERIHDIANAEELALGPDGTLYVCSSRPTNKVLRYASGAWTDITPNISDGRWMALCADPFDANRLFVFTSGGGPFRSTDKGQTWRPLRKERIARDIQWLQWTEEEYMSAGEVRFDPVVRNRLWFAQGIGVWRTEDVNDDTITWHSVSAGIEELVANDIIKVPGGPIICCVMDRCLFRTEDPDTYPDRHYPDARFRGARAADYCAEEPAFLVAALNGHLYSADAGKTWPPHQSFPLDNERGIQTIAVAANDPDNIVALASKDYTNYGCYYSKNRGRTWSAGELPGASPRIEMTRSKFLRSDKSLPNTFYLYHPGSGFYVSSDGGARWNRVNSFRTLPRGAGSVCLAVVPGQGGHLFLASAGAGSRENGLLHSRDQGASWTRNEAFEQAFSVAAGKAAPDAAYPAVFVHGVIAGQPGVWRSIDECQTWQLCVDYPLGIFCPANCMAADLEVFGKVYLGMRGASFAYGQPS